MDKTYAYVDESGNSDLGISKAGSSRFFVICSILVAEKNLQDAYHCAEALRRKHFQTGEIKSSKVRAKDAERRVRILTDLANLPIKLYFVAVEKERIYKDGGLQFKTSFVKHINGLLYNRLFTNCHSLQMMVDEHGGAEFQESLKAYVEDRYMGDLFGDDHAFQTKSSKDDVLIQVADFFAGSVAQLYEQKAVGIITEVYKKILREQTLGILEWPPKFNSLVAPSMDDSSYADWHVHQEALRQADIFIDKAGLYPDEDERLQLSILDYLRFQSEFVTKDYIPIADILAHLEERGFGDLSKQRVRSSGIAKLRDADVIITSTSKGYKIPQTRADINDFLEMASGVVVPLLERVKKAREVYMLSSRGEYDIIKASRLVDLQKLLSSLDDLITER